jgi:hypothetical protein
MATNKSTNAEAFAKLEAHTKKLEDRISSFKARKEALEQRHQNILSRQDILKKDHGGSNISPSDMIRLNVGGTEMCARRDTLTAVKDSRLEALFSGRWESRLLRDTEGRVFLDLDPTVFKMLLDSLFMIKLSSDVDPPPTNTLKNDLLSKYFEFFAVATTKCVPDQKQNDHSSEGILDIISNEEDFLSKFEVEIDDMEKQVEAEESFVKYFTVDCDEISQVEDSGSESSFSHVSSESNGKASEVSKSAGITHIKSRCDEDKGIMNLLIGSEIVAVKTSTLCLYPDSKLAKLFTDEVFRNQNSFMKDKKRLVLLDMPCYAFESIVNELRLRAMKIHDDTPIDASNMELYEAECNKRIAKYYLDIHVEYRIEFRDSTILQNWRDRSRIREWLAEVGHTKGPELLFRASRDGFNSNTCFNKCKDQGPTVTVVKTKEKGYIIGGYSDVSRNNSTVGSYHISAKAFLFSLNCHGLSHPQKYLCNDTDCALCTVKYSYSVTSFGFGSNDLMIDGASVSSILNYYRMGSMDQYTLLGDKYKHRMLDYEVYKV